MEWNAYLKAVDNYDITSIVARNRVPQGEEPIGTANLYRYATDFGYADSRGVEKGFDRRHRGVLRAIASLPRNVTLALNASIETGFLYPAAIGADERDTALRTAPANYTIDVRAGKRFALGTYGLDLFLDITNLTNRRNVIAYDAGIEASDAVQGIPARTLILPDGSSVYGPVRQVFFGARIKI